MKEVPERNRQFERIAELKTHYRAAGNLVVSMDTKKKEQIGNFYRHGSLYTTAEVQTFDHDFVRFSEGLIIPHAIYDLQLNHGFINIGVSRDTSQFACDSLRNWWQQKVDSTILMPPRSCSSGMAAAATMPATTSSNRSYRLSLMRSALKSGSHITPRIVPSTIRLNIASSPMSPAPVKALSSRVLNWSVNSSLRPKPNKVCP